VSKNKKILIESKVGILYYLLAFFFPTIFFFIDDANEVFENWTDYNIDVLFKLLSILMFFGIPILMIIFQKKMFVYNDRIELQTNILTKAKVYYFQNMISWNVYIVSGYRLITTKNLRVKFEDKKIDINEIESDSFNELLEFMKKKHNDKMLSNLQ
jgi:hypothetical protein